MRRTGISLRRTGTQFPAIVPRRGPSDNAQDFEMRHERAARGRNSTCVDICLAGVLGPLLLNSQKHMCEEKLQASSNISQYTHMTIVTEMPTSSC